MGAVVADVANQLRDPFDGIAGTVAVGVGHPEKTSRSVDAGDRRAAAARARGYLARRRASSRRARAGTAASAAAAASPAAHADRAPAHWRLIPERGRHFRLQVRRLRLRLCQMAVPIHRRAVKPEALAGVELVGDDLFGLIDAVAILVDQAQGHVVLLGNDGTPLRVEGQDHVAVSPVRRVHPLDHESRLGPELRLGDNLLDHLVAALLRDEQDTGSGDKQGDDRDGLPHGASWPYCRRLPPAGPVLTRFSIRKSPLLPGQTMSRSPSASMSTTGSCIPAPTRPPNSTR